MSKKVCSTCHGELGFMYVLTRSQYKCIPCHSAEKIVSKYLVNSLPDVEDMPPLDGKYRLGILAGSETIAKALADQYYETTPSMDDWEN